MSNSKELYNSSKGFYERWPERKKMILEIYPTMKGAVLNVGVHSFNQNDGICFPNKELYSTIDLIEENRKYGSKYNHITSDFLDLNDNTIYDNIILFGVLNIPDTNIGDNKNKASYTLNRQEDKIVNKLDKILSVNGRVLFGPDIPMSTKENSLITEEYYDNFFNNNDTIKKNFVQTLKFKGRGNILYEYTKVT